MDRADRRRSGFTGHLSSKYKRKLDDQQMLDTCLKDWSLVECDVHNDISNCASQNSKWYLFFFSEKYCKLNFIIRQILRINKILQTFFFSPPSV